MEISPTIASAAPHIIAAGGLALTTLSAWAVRLPKLAIVLLGIAVVAGQLVRLPLPGQGGGVLISDIAVLLVFGAAVGVMIGGSRSRTAYQITTRLTPFLLWSLFTLAINAPSLAIPDLAVAFAYWVRLSAYLLLVPALVILASQSKTRAWMFQVAVISVVFICILGLVQVWLRPDLSFLVSQGWDPHQGRLVSTWLDPNFVGGLLAIALPVSIAAFKKKPAVSLVVTSLIVISLILTQSRTSILALGAGALLIAPLIIGKIQKGKSTKRAVQAIATVAVICVVGLTSFVFLKDRLIGVIEIDPTVSLRVQSLAAAWPLLETHAAIGVGYNAYQFAAQQAGLIGDFSIHSRAGLDNTWMTLWVTTGIIGLVLFLWPWIYIVKKLIRNWVAGKQVLSITVAASLVILAIHANAINSFIYAHIMIASAVICALALTERSSDHA